MSAVCRYCKGSGETDAYGVLDCTAYGCTAAVERTDLEAANEAADPMTVYDQRWFAYQAGKAAAFEQAAKWYADKGWKMDEDDVPAAIRRLKP